MVNWAYILGSVVKVGTYFVECQKQKKHILFVYVSNNIVSNNQVVYRCPRYVDIE